MILLGSNFKLCKQKLVLVHILWKKCVLFSVMVDTGLTFLSLSNLALKLSVLKYCIPSNINNFILRTFFFILYIFFYLIYNHRQRLLLFKYYSKKFLTSISDLPWAKIKVYSKNKSTVLNLFELILHQLTMHLSWDGKIDTQQVVNNVYYT